MNIDSLPVDIPTSFVVINKNGEIVKSGLDDAAQVGNSALETLKQCGSLFYPGEKLIRVTVTFDDCEFVVSSRDNLYYIHRRSASMQT